MKNRVNRAGFTLMEMLIVVAIIAILVAIAIPVFSGQLEKTHAATCMANRRSLQSVVISSYMTGKTDGSTYEDTNAAYAEVFTGDEAAQKNYICPDKGEFSWTQLNNEIGYVTCNKHGAKSGAAAMQALAEQIKLRDQSKLFTDNIGKYLDNQPGKAMQYPLPDSVYFAGWSKGLIEEAEKLGIELKDGSWRIQQWTDGNYSIFLYDGNVMEKTVGEKIDVTKWTITTGGEITSQRGSVKVTSSTYTEDGKAKNFSAVGTAFTPAS